MSSGTVKGSHVIILKEWVDEKLGSDSFAALTKHAGDRWTVILPMAWYDIELVNEVFAEASARTGIPVEEISTQVCRLNAERDLTSIYRLFLRVAQPKLVLDHTPKLWRTYVSFGNASAIRNERGYYLGQGDGFEEHLVPWVCGCWLGFIPAAIRLAGGRDLKSRLLKKWRDPNGTYSVQLEVNYS